MLGATIGIALPTILFFLRWPQHGFALLMALLPFTVALNPLPGFDLQLMRLLVPLFWLAVFARYPKQFLAAAKKPQALLLWLFCVLVAVSVFFAQEPAWSARKLIYIWSFAPLLPAAAIILHGTATGALRTTGREHTPHIPMGLFVGGVLASLVGIAQFISQFFIGTDALFRFFVRLAPHLHGREFGALVAQYPSWFADIGGQAYLRAFAFFPDPHIFAFYLVMVSSLLLAFLLKARAKKDFYLYVTCYMLYITCLTLTFSRGGYLAWLASTTIVLGISWRSFAHRARVYTALGIGAALLLLAVGAPVVPRLGSVFDVSEGSNLGRLEIWRDALEKFAAQPLGVGLGNYAASAVNAVGLRNPITAHNLYLDLLVETGILGLAAFVALMVCTAYTVLRRYTESRNVVFLGALGAFAGFSTHAFFENPLYAPAILTLFLLIVALSLVESPTSSGPVK